MSLAVCGEERLSIALCVSLSFVKHVSSSYSFLLLSYNSFIPSFFLSFSFGYLIREFHRQDDDTDDDDAAAKKNEERERESRLAYSPLPFSCWRNDEPSGFFFFFFFFIWKEKYHFLAPGWVRHDRYTQQPFPTPFSWVAVIPSPSFRLRE